MKKGFSILLALVMVLSIFTVIPVSVSAEEADITEVGAQEKAMFILKNLNISQGVNGQYSHEGTKAIDCAEAKGVSAYAPFTGTIKKIYSADANVVWLESNSQVLFADGTVDYMTIMVEHDNDVSDLYVGKVIKQGERFYEAGDNGWVTGPHIHLECGKGRFVSGGWYKNSYGRWMIYNAVNPYDALYLSESTNVINGYGYNWRRTDVTPKPSNPWIKASKTSIPTGGSITFTFGADKATGYTIGIDKNGSRMITEGVSSGKSYTFNDEGNYSAYVTCYNSAGSVDSSRVSFSVFAPVILGNDFTATITNSKGGMNIGANSEGNVVLQTKSDSDNQKWHFVRQADNTYRITNVGYHKCLDVSGANTASGTNIQLWSENTSDAQRFYIRDAGYGYALVPLVNTSLAIDIYNGSLTNGTNIQDYTWNGTVAQIFSIDYVGLKPPIYRDYNGHTYEFYNIQVPWNQAYRFCENKGGHLVTISDDAENFAVYELCGGSIGAIWIGATDFSREGNWYWVTGEPLSYDAWYPGEPNNTGGAENYGMMYIDAGTLGDSGTVGTIRKWNDMRLAFAPNVSYTVGFVCEYDNGDVNADSYTPLATETIDGITYSIFDYCVDWQTAEAICESKGGQLVKIDSAEKNNTVVQLMEKGRKSEYWINATDRFSEGTWTDSEGNALSYSNWVDGNPDNAFNAEQFVMISKGTGKWGDLKGFSPYYRGTGFICESRVPTGITLNKEELSLMIGDTSTLKATVTPTGVDDTVTWKSSNTKVATVTKSGKITGKSEGYSFVTATTVNGLEATCIVLVGGSRYYILGDTDEDGEVTIIDATCIQRHLASIPTAIYNEKASDADEDGEVTIIDATSIQRMLAELPHNNNIGITFSGGSLPRLSDWTDWSTTVPTGNTIVESESRTEYRYKDKKEYREATQPATPEGYKLVFSDYCGLYSDWSAWSGWSTSRQNADGTLKQEGTTTGYRYYAFVCPNCGNRDPYNIPGNNNCSNCGYGGALNWNEMYYESIGSSAPGNTYYDNSRNYVTLNGQRWYYEKPDTNNGAGGTGQPTTTMYRYRTRSELIYYRFEQIDFSSWQTDPVAASDTRTVETRTVYRYRYLIK